MASELEVDLKVERAALEFAYNDLHLIYSAGKSLVQGKDDYEVEQFFAMFESITFIRDQYTSRYLQCSDMAIRKDSSTSFPNEEDSIQRNRFNLYYYKIIEFYNKLRAKETPQNDQSTQNAPRASTLNTTLSSQARLPVIGLPTFSGTITEWNNYKQLFNSLIHENTEIPTIQRYHYLCSTLKGEALKVISAFAISEENYEKAFEALCKRYDNKRLLAATYLERVFAFPPLTGPPSLNSLQEFIATVAENVAAFKSIEVPNEADFLWLSLALRKLDSDTRKQFEIASINSEWPTFKELETFIHNRARVLQLADSSVSSKESTPLKPTRYTPNKGHVFTTTHPPNTKVCSCLQQHALYECPIFRSKSVAGRRSFLKGRNICYKCLRSGHIASTCSSHWRCKFCSGGHHSLLHANGTKEDSTTSPVSRVVPGSSPPGGAKGDKTESPSVIASVTGPTQVLLGTALVHILDEHGKAQPARAIIDSGSQFSLMTTTCAKRLGLAWRASNHRPLGAGEVPLPRVKGRLKCTLSSRFNSEVQFNIEPLVVTSITGKLPPYPLDPPKSQFIDLKQLADPNFFSPNDIDMLLGADLFMSILSGPPVKIDDHYEALPTSLGLIVMGKSDCSASPLQLRCHCLVELPISEEIFNKFWDIEDNIPEAVKMPPDPCEEEFLKNHCREADGRYVVSLPFKEPPIKLEGSRELALRRFQCLEKKMERSPTFKEKYHAFLEEYKDLGHMSPSSAQSGYVIPHHGVFKRNDDLGKIRVVFDASAKTINGSLNDKLHTGPNLQRDISEVILNFRRYPVAVTGDLVKMYRQILIRPEDRRFLHILWRSSPNEPISTFQLNTVTYGTKPAMFQAKRTLIQLVQDEGHVFPLAARALLDDSYVDDIVSGANNEEDALVLMDQLINLLAKGKFEIHKWSSNSPKLLQAFDSNSGSIDLSPKEVPTTKILGLAWDPVRDEFHYKVELPHSGITKRAILSIIARLFDPIGFLSPAIFMAKIIFQATWRSKRDGKAIEWDQEPEEALVKQWLDFVTELPKLNNIRIPRYVFCCESSRRQIIGFCDASERGFAAALYLRSISDVTKVSLLKGKTRLAPLKTISIPKLELCGAHLLVKTLNSIKHLITTLDIEEVYLYTDSTIVLSWLNISPHQLQTFVANRVAFILTHTQSHQWFHVSSHFNPADLASRGVSPSELQFSALWWAGPEWLHQLNWTPQPTPISTEQVPELKSGVILLENDDTPELIVWMKKFSNYRTLLRVLAYIQRFLFNMKTPDNRSTGPLSVQELDSALLTCIKITQHYEFRHEIDWKNKTPISKRLQILNAYLDDHDILRVGGRLSNADLPPEAKFPIILNGQCHLSSLLINYLHNVNFHMGHFALQSLIRRKYWIFRLRQTIKYCLAKCLTCFKMKAEPLTPFMGDLPSCRVRPSIPFSHCGVDYAGPFSIKLSTRRNAAIEKCYLCVFICLATRAVHLEVVTSLTTEAFLAALERFIARRGRPSYIRSDCGTNFVGAARRLRELFGWLRQEEVRHKIITRATDHGIQWSFNPPHAPHFGGIWEAAVKSAKRHLYKVVGDRAFNYEELVTLFTKIEAILNSRPLCSTPDTDHGDILTPGHFLIGAPLLALPEPDLTITPVNRLSRWQLVKNTVQGFWKRWHSEYVQTLQKRPKWYHNTKPLKKGDLILIADSSSSPLQWKTSRVEECFPGGDGITRVVSIKDRGGTRKVPVHTLVSLSHLSEPEVTQI